MYILIKMAHMSHLIWICTVCSVIFKRISLTPLFQHNGHFYNVMVKSLRNILRGERVKKEIISKLIKFNWVYLDLRLAPVLKTFSSMCHLTYLEIVYFDGSVLKTKPSELH